MFTTTLLTAMLSLVWSLKQDLTEDKKNKNRKAQGFSAQKRTTRRGTATSQGAEGPECVCGLQLLVSAAGRLLGAEEEGAAGRGHLAC